MSTILYGKKTSYSITTLHENTGLLPTQTLLQLSLNYSSHIVFTLDWPKSSFTFFCNILWKNPNELFGQPNTKDDGRTYLTEKQAWRRDLQDGGVVRRGDHFSPHKYIRNTTTCGTTPTEHLLNAGRRPQASQKARNSPRTWAGKKEKRKNRDKRIGTGLAPPGGSCEGGKVSTH